MRKIKAIIEKVTVTEFEPINYDQPNHPTLKLYRYMGMTVYQKTTVKWYVLGILVRVDSIEHKGIEDVA